MLYNTDVCMQLFNVVSPKFGERGGTMRMLMGYVR
jgi:hypothetical protein